MKRSILMGKRPQKSTIQYGARFLFVQNVVEEIVFLKDAFDFKTYKVLERFPCPKCNTSCTKDSIDLAFVSKYDEALSDVTQAPKRVPVLINYTIGKTVHEKGARWRQISH